MSRARSPSAPRGDRVARIPGLVTPDAGGHSERHVCDLATDSSLWSDADELVAISSFTLRQALTVGPLLPLHDGTTLLPIGRTGIYAAIDAREYDGPEDAFGGPLLDAVVTAEVGGNTRDQSNPNAHWEELTQLVPYLHARLDHTDRSTDGYETSVGASLPLGLTFCGAGLYVRVHYGASALLADASSQRDAAALGAAAAVMGQALADEDAAARAYRQRLLDDDD